MILIPAPAPLPFGNKIQEADNGGGLKKKKPTRARGLQRSRFDRSVPLVVL